MTPDQIVQSAVRNHSLRRGMFARLSPTALIARQRADQLREAQSSPLEALRKIEQMEVLKKVPNFFPTPPKVIVEMLKHFEIRPGMRILDPEAGKADLLKVARKFGANAFGYEFNDDLATIVRQEGFPCICGDFLKMVPPPEEERFDGILMNPPFDHSIDQKHVEHAIHFLRRNAKLVSVVFSGTAKKLENWLNDHNGYSVDLPTNSFRYSERPTGVDTSLVVAFRI